MKKIKNLTATELARYASNVFLYVGRNSICATLIYRCLELEPNHPVGLRALSDFFDQEGTEALSAIVLEYLIEAQLSLTPEAEQENKQLLFQAKWWWGFAKHKSGNTNLSAEELMKHEDFEVSEEQYQTFIGGLIEGLGSKKAVVENSVKLLGIYGGIINGDVISENDTLLDILKRNDLNLNGEYETYLNESTEELETFMKKCEENHT